MSDSVQFHSRVGDDGVLNLQVNLGGAEAKRDVLVTIESLETSAPQGNDLPLDWHDFVRQTYGSCAGLGLERFDQGQLEKREPIE